MRNQLWIWILGIIILGVLADFFWPKGSASAPTNNAPYGETQTATTSGAQAGDSNPSMESSYVGTWQSQQDAKYERTYDANGTVTDTYAGDDSATVTGTWSLVADISAENITLPDVHGATIMKVTFPDTPPFYYAITEVSSTSLSMNYLNGNGSLNFTRVQ